MKQQLFFAAILLMASSIQSQEAKPVVIVNATGKVVLLPQGATSSMELQSGAVAKSTGQLQLAKRSTAVVYCNGQFLKVKGNQTVALDSICGAGSVRRSLNFDHDFGNAMMAAIEMVAVAKKRGDGWSNAVTDPKKMGDGWGTAVTDPKKMGDGWGTAVTDPKKMGDGWGTAVTDPKKMGDGWGGKGANIRLIMPFGKLLAATTTFFWSRPSGINTYQFVILDEANTTIRSLVTRDTFAQIDIRRLNLNPGKKYHWKVITSGNPALVSNELEFVIGNKEERMEALRNAKASTLSKSGKNPSLRGLTEAIALENAHWFYDAQKKYAELHQRHPDGIVRMMHSAFWLRYGFNRLAQKAVQG